MEGAECRRKPKGEQGGHERIALLATFGLRDKMGDAFIVSPHERRRRAIEQADKGKHGAGFRRVLELGEHGCTRGQGKLVGAGCFINVAAVMLGKRAGNQTAEEIPDNKSTDASGWFAQCNEASKAEC